MYWRWLGTSSRPRRRYRSTHQMISDDDDRADDERGDDAAAPEVRHPVALLRRAPLLTETAAAPREHGEREGECHAARAGRREHPAKLAPQCSLRPEPQGSEATKGWVPVMRRRRRPIHRGASRVHPVFNDGPASSMPRERSSGVTRGTLHDEGGAIMTTTLQPPEATIDERATEFDLGECLRRLRDGQVGSVAYTADGFPAMLPVYFRLVETSAPAWIALRAERERFSERAPVPVVFEIGGRDETNGLRWSVVVRGLLEHVDPDAADFRERFDPEPWLIETHPAWLVIEPFSIAGWEIHDA